MYIHVSCTSSDKYSAALERRMFLCYGVSSACHLLEACVTILRWWCFTTCSPDVATGTSLSPPSRMLPCQTAVPGVDGFRSATLAVSLPTAPLKDPWLYYTHVVNCTGPSGYLESRKTLLYVCRTQCQNQPVAATRLACFCSPIRLDCAQKVFGKHEYIPVSISQLTNNGGGADPNGRMGVSFMKMINVTAIARFGTKSWPS